nr:MAG TPA: hypothetical protein [Caudoviricetes sp.]
MSCALINVIGFRNTIDQKSCCFEQFMKDVLFLFFYIEFHGFRTIL